MQGDARQAAVEAMAVGGRGAAGMTLNDLGSMLDAIPPGVLAQLAIERGGLEHVESYHDVICPLFIWEYEPDLFDEKPMDCDCGHVYRLSPDVSSVAETPETEQ